MLQAKFSITPMLSEFISDYKVYGFKDKSSMVQAALLHLKEKLEIQNLTNSAALYAEIYDEEPELQKLTDAAVKEWPE